MKLVIPGKPISKKRPRFARRGKFVAVINDQETEEGRFLWEISRQVEGHELFEGAIRVVARYYMPIPKSTSKKKRNYMQMDIIKHTKKPDLDNLTKFAWDCLKGIVWGDDCQVVESDSRKTYDSFPRTELIIMEV